ncbi:MAG: hypothetical protein HOV97_31795 [Nonomuraea sp.]|nr:hypothetical protein [Nonomuraea sp.]
MRRYRFGRIAAPLAVAYVAVAVAFGVVAFVTGDPVLLRRLVTHDGDPDFVPYVVWVEAVLVMASVLQGWAYWQVLRGRRAGELTDRGRAVGLLRAALYASVALSLLYLLPFPSLWWLSSVGTLVQLAVVWLFFVVLADAVPRWLRLAGLVAGVCSALIDLAELLGYRLGMTSVVELVGRVPVPGLLHLLWLVPVLVAQGRDARWSRTTVRVGVISAVLSFLSYSGGIVSFLSVGGMDYHLLFFLFMGVLGVFGTVWEARSAHELAHPLPASPPARVAPERAAARPWPLAAVAVVLPLIPAAVNLAHGMPAWIGPRGAAHTVFAEYASLQARLAWTAADLLVGVGAPAALILVAVVRRTRRLLRVTLWTLGLAAVAGVVTTLTDRRDPERDPFFPQELEERLRFYPDGLFGDGAQGRLTFGLSPMWFSAALAAAALLLFLLYAPAPARRRPAHVAALATALTLALGLLPTAGQPRGPVTPDAACFPPDQWRMEEFEPPTGALAYVCQARQDRALGFAPGTPDQVLLARGHRLCGVYTRDDPQELARVRERENVDVRHLEGALASICPSADAAVKEAQAAEDREMEELEAEERAMCASVAPHKPRLRPARSIVVKDPEWAEAGLEIYEDSEESADPSSDGVFEKALDNGLVASAPGHLALVMSSDLRVCITLETYDRRPPVETRGWDHVVEVGYESPTGRMELLDGLGGNRLPDLSLDGRKGHYRIRAHFAWIPWKGGKYGSQRMLIMAYPAKGDKVITYRAPDKRR